jgi:peptide/nickel transport system ATP-binding protein
MAVAATPDIAMDVRGLTKHFPVGDGLRVGQNRRFIHAVDDVSFELGRGRIVALVGESGSGKSTIARLLARLYPATSGEVIFRGRNILGLRGSELLDYRGRVQMVFQDPFGSLNPVKSIGHHIERPLLIHRQAGRGDARERVHDLLRQVGLTPPDQVARKLPHELSGGQRQRVAFARALAVNPEVILADEPISMLDVSIRMGILNLMKELRDEHDLSCLYITHDLASARYLAEETLVLYAGQLMEAAPSGELMSEPLHPYTRLLLSAVPDPKTSLQKRRIEARGEIPTIVNPAPGCRFSNRCPLVMDICRRVTPGLTEPQPGHRVRCHLYDEGAGVSAASG